MGKYKFSYATFDRINHTFMAQSDLAIYSRGEDAYTKKFQQFHF